MIEEIKGLTVLELSELVHALEEEFGVSAAAMAAPAAAYQRHFPLGAACPYHYVASVYPLYVFRMGCYHSLQHFFHNVVWFVNHFFQSKFLLLHYAFYYYKAESVCHSGI